MLMFENKEIGNVCSFEVCWKGKPLRMKIILFTYKEDTVEQKFKEEYNVKLACKSKIGLRYFLRQVYSLWFWL